MITTLSKTEQLKSLILKDIRKEIYQPGSSLPSIRQLCDRYGVSKHTASQALSNLNEMGIIELLHGKITRIAANPFRKQIEIIYVGNTPIEQQEFWSEFYRGIVDEFQANPEFKFVLRSITVHGGTGAIKRLDIANTAGILVLGSASRERLDYLRQYAIPFVLLYDRVEEDGISFVTADLRRSLTDMVALFKNRGCRRVAYIGAFAGQADEGINIDKMNYFKDALLAAGLPVDKVLFQNAEHKMPCGYETMKTLLATQERPDGLFVASDILAVGAYRAMNEAGLRPGIDIAIAGCDNLEIGNYLTPSLTTIELSRYRQGQLAAKRLMGNINGEAKTEIREVLSAEIVIRESLTT